MKKQVALIKITEHGNDLAVYLNGEYIISADPGCGDDPSMVEQVAESLAILNGVDVTHIDYPAHEEWQWNDIQADLQDRDHLVGGLKDYSLDHHVIDSDGELHEKTLTFQSVDTAHAIEQLIDFYSTLNEKVLWVSNVDHKDSSILYQTGDAEFQLNPVLESTCIITIGTACVYIKRNDEGVAIDIYPADNETADPIESSWVLYPDCISEPA